MGVSAGERRLKDYLSQDGKTNGEDNTPILKMGSKKKTCRGVFLYYLAGQHDKVRSSKTKKSKIENQLVKDYYQDPYWSMKHEKHVIKALNDAGFKTIQGKEWFVVDTDEKMKTFIDIVTKMSRALPPPPIRTSGRKTQLPARFRD